MQDNQVKNDNLLVLQKALEQELLNEVVTKLDLYEIKINEVFIKWKQIFGMERTFNPF